MIDRRVNKMQPFSVFIPVYNEEMLITKNTAQLIDYLNTLQTAHEIIIVSNGSTDRTPELGQELQRAYQNVRFFHLDEKGPGTALQKGITLAKYDNIISVDMDLTVDLEFIRMADRLLADYDLVVGSKRMSAQKRSLIRKIASSLFIFCAMILLGLSFDDYSLAAKAYKRKVLEGCQGKIRGGTFYVVEALYYATTNRLPIVQIPAACHDTRTSKFNLIHEGIYRFGNLFLMWMRTLRSP